LKPIVDNDLQLKLLCSWYRN